MKRKFNRVHHQKCGSTELFVMFMLTGIRWLAHRKILKEKVKLGNKTFQILDFETESGFIPAICQDEWKEN